MIYKNIIKIPGNTRIAFIGAGHCFSLHLYLKIFRKTEAEIAITLFY